MKANRLTVCFIVLSIASEAGFLAPLRRSTTTSNAEIKVLASGEGALAILAAGRGHPNVFLLDGCDLPNSDYHAASFGGAFRTTHTLETGQLIPLSVTSGDFDEDGVPDIASGFSSAGGGVLAIQRGNVDAIYPHSAEALQRKAQGHLTLEPFLSPAAIFALPEAPDFLAAGDFNGDGHWDIVAAKAGSVFLRWLRGNGKGDFQAGPDIPLTGEVTALAAGEINRRDGLTDIIVAVTGGIGSQLLVYEGPKGALDNKPEIIPLPAAVHSLALGQLDNDPFYDVALPLGNQLAIMHGRDRKLSLDVVSRAAVPLAWLEPRALAFEAVSIAAGDFLGRRYDCLALLDNVGAVHFFDPRQTNEGPGEVALRDRTVQALATNAALRTSAQGWLVRTHTSTGGSDDVLVLDKAGRHLALVPGMVSEPGGQRDEPGRAQLVTFDTLATPAAVLPMRLNNDAMDDLVLLQDKPGAYLAASLTTAALNFVIDSLALDRDSDDCLGYVDCIIHPDGICRTQYGTCTLAAATFECSASAKNTSCSFGFNIGGVTGAPQLPDLNPLYNLAYHPHIIDGTTQPGGWVRIYGWPLTANSTGRGLIIGNSLGLYHYSIAEGNRLGTTDDGQSTLAGAGSSIYPYAVMGGTVAAARNIISPGGDGVRIVGDHAKIQGNYIGADVTGTKGVGDGIGIRFYSNQNALGVVPHDITIGGTVAGAGNLITALITMDQGTDTYADLIQGNLIGTDLTGTQVPLLAWGGGIRYSGHDSTIGGTTVAARNVIVGTGDSDSAGTAVDGQNILIQGNYIGVDISGILALGKLHNGIAITDTSQVTVGGEGSDFGNVIVGCSNGVFIRDNNGPTASALVLGNFIGTDKTGLLALANQFGVWIENSSGTTVGALTAAHRNVIAGNTYGGIVLTGAASQNNLIQSNYIGVGIDGKTALGNGWYGIWMFGSPANNTIGGTADGAGNIIANSTSKGIFLQNQTATYAATGAGNAILGNIIYSNGKLGISFSSGGSGGPTPNDYQDPDTGPNNLQNAPVLTGSEIVSGLAIRGTLNSTPMTTFRLEFFTNCNLNSAGRAEGEIYLGAINVSTSSMGDALFYQNFPYYGSCRLVTTTATDPGNNTSEFSEQIETVGNPIMFFPCIVRG